MTVTVRFAPQFRDSKRDGSAQNHGARLVLWTPFEMKDAVKRIPGARFTEEAHTLGGKPKAWHVPASPEAAREIVGLIEGVSAQVDRPTLELMARGLDALDAQRYKDPKVWGELPQFPSRNPSWGHQLAAYYGNEHRMGAGLGMDMGTGKSKVVVGLTLSAWGARLQVILSPRKVLKVWPREFRLHSPHDDGCPRALPQPAFDSETGIAAQVEPGVTLDLLDPDQAAAAPCKCGREPLVFNGMRRNRKGKLVLPPMIKRVEEARATLTLAARMRRPAVLSVNYEAAWQGAMREFLLDPLAGLPDDVVAWYQAPELAATKSGKIYGAVSYDESHKIKSASGKWSRFAAELTKRADRAILATGTVMPHGEDDVYGQCRAADPAVFGTNHKNFVNRFFVRGGFEDREIIGFLPDDPMQDLSVPNFPSRARDDFTRRLGEVFFFCDAEDVLPFLPKAQHLPTQVCELGKDAQRYYDELDTEFMTWLKDVDTDEPVVAKNALAKLLRLAQITSGHLPHGEGADRKIVEVDRSKAALLKDTLEDIGAGKAEPVVVFCRFTHDLANVRRVAAELGLSYGEISGRQDDLGEDGKWTADQGFEIMGVQLQAGGVGIDLTLARYCIYYSLSFSLGDHEQSLKRVHRPGQTRETFYVYLAAAGTVDEVIAEALRERKEVLKAVQDAAKRGSWDSEFELAA
jgi:hypothetical protein